MNTVQHDIGPPPDDYRQLPIVPDVREILSERRTYLRENIVNGLYEDPQHYLDVSVPLTRKPALSSLIRCLFRSIFVFCARISLVHCVRGFNSTCLVKMARILTCVCTKMFAPMVPGSVHEAALSMIFYWTSRQHQESLGPIADDWYLAIYWF